MMAMPRRRAAAEPKGGEDQVPMSSSKDGGPKKIQVIGEVRALTNPRPEGSQGPRGWRPQAHQGKGPPRRKADARSRRRSEAAGGVMRLRRLPALPAPRGQALASGWSLASHRAGGLAPEGNLSWNRFAFEVGRPHTRWLFSAAERIRRESRRSKNFSFVPQSVIKSEFCPEVARLFKSSARKDLS
jgi:hypothetical protein